MFIYLWCKYGINYIISGTLFLLAITFLKVAKFNIYFYNYGGAKTLYTKDRAMILMWGNLNY